MLKKGLKWIGIIVGGLVGLLALAVVVLYFVGGTKVNEKYEVPVETISIPTDADAVQRGEHLAIIYICTRCHTANLGGELSFVVPGVENFPLLKRRGSERVDRLSQEPAASG
jgi:flagellar basal body-associated protein FliL